jgi:hypothetical protein
VSTRPDGSTRLVKPGKKESVVNLGQISLIAAGVLVVLVVVAARRRGRRVVAGIADREPMARARGWRYREKDAALATRWKEVLGRRVHLSVAYGIVSGEHHGMPFTVFDTEVAGSDRLETIYVVHLPVSYPSVAVVTRMVLPQAEELSSRFFGGASAADIAAAMKDMPRDVGSEVRLLSGDPIFGKELLSPGLRRATLRHGLPWWWIQGRDLVFRSGGQERSATAEEMLQMVARVVDVARSFPPGLAARFGTPPTTDIPFAEPT